jgi:hypothetical protein
LIIQLGIIFEGIWGEERVVGKVIKINGEVIDC